MQIYIPSSISNVVEVEEKPSKTYALDLRNNRIAGTIDGIDAINQAIIKTIITPRFKHIIYDNQYGSELTEMIASKDSSPQFINSSAKGFIQDALSVDSRIHKIYDFNIEFLGDSCLVECKVDTIFGTLQISEVI